MTEWREVKLENVCIKITDGSHWSPKSQESGYPMASVKDMGESELDLSSCRKISKTDFEELVRQDCKPKVGDVLIAKDGSYLKQIFDVKNEQDVVILSSIAIIRPNKQSVTPRFLKYVFKNPTFQEMVSNNYVSGAVIPRIVLKDFCKIPFSLPPLDVQKRIAGILGALDDRIDVLRRENVVLEQMAQAVFQSWFVDFDIVRAKAAGTPESEVCEKYHITPELYALFPSALTPDNLPLGWEKKKLGELVQNIKKSVKPSVETEHKPYVPIDCITAKTLTLYDFKDGKEAQSSLISFESRDILFGAMRAYFHKVCIAPFAGTTRSTVFCLRPKAPKDFSFALLSIFQNRCISYASQNSKGTTMPYAVWDNNLSEYQTEASTEDMRVAFNEYLGNSFDKMMLNAQQIRALSATRDALLPKLMNGEIEV